MNLTNLTNEQLVRIFSRIIQRINDAYDGGGKFGFDLITLRMVDPDLYQEYITIRKEGRRRKQAGLSPV